MGGVAAGRSRPAPPLKTFLPGSAPLARSAVSSLSDSNRSELLLRASGNPVKHLRSAQVPKRERASVGRTHADHRCYGSSDFTTSGSGTR
ncbi:hypothetical protein NDU88_006409 [Pleurodeles waltl]|uniref:Uncharacterized protein n=1 Tax=Pleurodeles waltl TaxID=8319 RepID=A0AAV7TYG3_PLEWA|nr:hypothetical protein NDU88_006409 [Pleurodeles waltl]